MECILEKIWPKYVHSIGWIYIIVTERYGWVFGYGAIAHYSIPTNREENTAWVGPFVRNKCCLVRGSWLAYPNDKVGIRHTWNAGPKISCTAAHRRCLPLHLVIFRTHRIFVWGQKPFICLPGFVQLMYFKNVLTVTNILFYRLSLKSFFSERCVQNA